MGESSEKIFVPISEARAALEAGAAFAMVQRSGRGTSVRTLLVGSLLVVLILLLLGTVLNYVFISRLNQALAVMEEEMERANAALEVGKATADLLVALSQGAASHSVADFPQMVREAEQSLLSAEERLTEDAGSLSPDDPIRIELYELENRTADIRALADRLLLRAEEGMWWYVEKLVPTMVPFHRGLVTESVERMQVLTTERWIDAAAEAEAARRVMQVIPVVSGLLIMGVAAGTVFVTVRSIARPIERLTEAATRLAAGHLEERVRTERIDEFGRLAFVFNEMANQLEVSYAQLEQRVADRTAALQQRTVELEQLGRNLEEAVDESRRRALRLEAASQVSRAVASVLEPEQLLKQVVNLIADRVGYYHVGIFMLDETGQYAVLRAANSEGGQRMLARGHRLRIGEQGIVGEVAHTGQPRIALDVGADAMYFDNPDLPATRSEMALPLVARERILGALDVQSMEAEAFDDEDVAVLQTLADQIAVALDNAHLFQESQERLREMQRIQAQYTVQGWRGRQTEQRLGIVEYTRAGVEPLGSQLLAEATRVAASGEPFVTSGDDVEAGAADGQTPASLVVPLKLHGQTIGVLGFQETEQSRMWTADEVALAEAIADELVQVLESARLFEETQQRAWRERAVGQITGQIRASADIEDILQTAAEELGRTLGVSRAIVRLRSQEATSEAAPASEAAPPSEASIQGPKEALS